MGGFYCLLVVVFQREHGCLFLNTAEPNLDIRAGALEYCDRAIAQGDALSDAGRAVLTSLRSSIARLMLSVNDAFERLDRRDANEEENCTQCVVCVWHHKADDEVVI